MNSGKSHRSSTLLLWVINPKKQNILTSTLLNVTTGIHIHRTYLCRPVAQLDDGLKTHSVWGTLLRTAGSYRNLNRWRCIPPTPFAPSSRAIEGRLPKPA
jgi:hypothetical protein